MTARRRTQVSNDSQSPCPPAAASAPRAGPPNSLSGLRRKLLCFVLINDGLCNFAVHAYLHWHHLGGRIIGLTVGSK